MTGGEGDTSQIIAPDIEYAASRIPEENIVNGNPLILLSHQPREWEKADTHGVNLMVSGHTHGGQAFPMHAFIIIRRGMLDYFNRMNLRTGTTMWVRVLLGGGRGLGF